MRTDHFNYRLASGLPVTERANNRKLPPVILSTLIVLSTLGLMFAESPRDSEMRVGYVDSSTILGLFPAARAAQAKLDTLIQDWSDTLSRMSKQYRDEVTTFGKQSAMMTVQARTREQQEINILLRKMQNYRLETVGQGGELDRARARLMKPIRSSVYSAIAVVAKRERMKFVLDKNNQIPVVLYADPYYDITYKVLDLLTRHQPEQSYVRSRDR